MTDYKLVPVEPTKEMQAAGANARYARVESEVRDIYRAMLAAAPDVRGEPVGYQCREVGSGEAAWSLCSKQEYETICRLAGRPRYDGRIRESRPLYTAPHPDEDYTPEERGFPELEPAPDAADCEQVLDDQWRLTRELDVLLNGENGAAQQASLCDLVAQLRTVVRNTGKPVLAAPDVAGLVEALESLINGCVGLLEAGMNRITSLGGDCDPVPIMEQNDPWLRDARAALAAYRKGGDA